MLNELYKELCNLLVEVVLAREKTNNEDVNRLVYRFNEIIRELREYAISVDQINLFEPKRKPGRVEGGIGVVEDYGGAKEKIDELKHEIIRILSRKTEDVILPESIKIVRNLCKNVHNAVRHLKNPRDGVAEINIEDEYGLQYLFKAIVYSYFSDVRPEENTPSWANDSKRMDFLLKKEKTVIELKFVSENNKSKIRKQLQDDIFGYKTHPDCRKLFCVVYDPEGLVQNPHGIINDLERESKENYKIEVFIKPE